MILNDLDNISSSYMTNLFNEADGDAPAPTNNATPTGGNDYQVEDPDVNNETTTEEPTEETNEEDTATEDNYQMEDPDAGGDDMGMGDDAGGEEDQSGGYDNDTGMGGEDRTTQIKKLRLMQQYKELYATANSLFLHIQNYYKTIYEYQYDDISYLLSRITTIKRDLIFTISVRFADFDYQKLLTLYSYFEEEIKKITELIENVAKFDKDE